ncbi:MAG TPA: hypothetical protein VFI19_16330 [Nocardioides sp.]|nr:hypothetical protein [Nocardioides sp.]
MLTRSLSRHISYANVVATLALIVALTGGAYAATQLPKNSVASKQVKNSSLMAKDFKPGQLPSGSTGPQGPQGPRGLTGQDGPSVLTTGYKRGPFSQNLFSCSGVHQETDLFTVPVKAVAHVDATYGFQSTVSADLESQVFLIDVHGGVEDPVAVAGYTVAYNVDAANPVVSGLLTVNGDVEKPYALLPGHTYKLHLAGFDQSPGNCTESIRITWPSIQWMTYPFPSAS